MKRTGTLLVLAALLAGCGGGSETVAGIDAGGTPDPVATNIVSSGTITGFGSIIVNDVHYDTSDAQFVVDGAAASQSALAVGDVVVVQGTLSDDGTTGTASSVTFDDAVEGPVSAIDLAGSTLTVLGQLVHVDADTSFDDSIIPASLEGLTPDDIVEVSGFLRADGSIAATRIEAKPAGEEFEVTGSVTNLDTGALTFTIGGLTVDYSAAQLDDFPGGAPEEGQVVEARGAALGAAGELPATRVEFKGNDFPGDAGDRVEVEGFITRFVSASDFDVEGRPVTTDGGTVFENGTSADLGLNRKVEVEGVLDDAGVIDASEVELKQAGFIRIVSTVESIGSDRLTVLGIEVRVDTSTRMEDKSDAGVEPFTLQDLAVGDFVEVRGFEDADGVKASLLEREDPENTVELRGFVESASSPDFVILGVTIRTDGGTVFRDLNDAVIDSATFFGQADGRLVEADGTLGNGVILAEEVELED